MLPAGAGPPAGLPVDSYTSSYATNAAAGGVGAAPLMYPSFQLPGAKPECEQGGGQGGAWGSVLHAVQCAGHSSTNSVF